LIINPLKKEVVPYNQNTNAIDKKIEDSKIKIPTRRRSNEK